MKKCVWILILAAVLLTVGCAKDDAGQETSGIERSDFVRYEEYLEAVVQESENIKTRMETEEMNQGEMNAKSQELYVLWDNALNALWDELKVNLDEGDFAKLEAEQLEWNSEKDAAVEAAAKDYEGGSMYPLVVNTTAARLTEERVYQLADIMNRGEGIGQTAALSDSETAYLEAQTTNTWLDMSDMEKSDFVALIGRWLEAEEGYIIEDYDEFQFMLNRQMEQYFRHSVDEDVTDTVLDILELE